VSAPANSPPRLASVPALLELAELAGAPLRYGHLVRVLRDGALAFPAMIAAIRAARASVCFENFILAHDATGEEFARALERARGRGVRVRVLYDPVGTLLVRGGSVAARLRPAGIAARPFRPLSALAPWSWIRLRHRDHRKLLVCDERTAVIGGICIADHWAPAERGGGGWRDTALLVRGPVVADLQQAFDRMWRRARGPLSLDAHFGASGDPKGDAAACVVGDLPGTGRVARIYTWLADHAQESIELTDAYFVAPPIVTEALIRAAGRGVHVRLLVPGRNNHPVMGFAARRIYAPLLEAGVEIHEWNGVMLHAKTAVVDGLVTLVGSSNLDPLSLRRNFELNLLVGDPETGRRMRELFAADLRGAARVDPAEWRRRPRGARIAEALATLAARLL
jgi:cardiolipin synthase A/B